jgi:hypothetical protein
MLGDTREGSDFDIQIRNLDSLQSAVFFSHRTEDVNRPDRLIEGDHLMPDVAGDAIEIAGLERFLFASNEEHRPAFEQHAHLFVRMLVLLDHRVRSDVHE